MTIRQRIMKWVYPLLMGAAGRTQKGATRQNKNAAKPLQPFHALAVQLLNGDTLSLESLRGKKVLLVNTASDCGFTPQYAELQTLYGQAKGGLEIIGFPANDFKEQEKGSNEEIAAFCSRNYGVDFPVAKKSVVLKAPGQNPVFHWLTDASLNGWNSEGPSWNFAKYLVNEEGLLTHCFEPAVSPLSDAVRSAVDA